MNREILFRGKRIDSGGWIMGFLIRIGELCFIFEHMDESMYLKLRNNKRINTDQVLGKRFIAVYSQTIGQFTGLTDKNGVKIFEGDIIKSETDGYGYVVWDDSAFAIKSPGSEAIDWVHSSEYAKYEIVGNIHDNPELIK
jgi:uncharacterized phage protein (TIGR01671 family)